MSLDQSYKLFEAAHTEAREWFQGELANIRTGRVKNSLVESIQVEHYGSRTPLQGVASISTVDARTLVISPWDSTAMPAIEKALIEAQLGAQPVADGKVIRLSFPMLSEEMREKTIKLLHKKAEEARVRLRVARDEALSILKNDKEKSDITEDDFYEGKENLNTLIDKANNGIASLVEKKEVELRTI